ncbi:MAG: M48 family metalloprotease [Cyclobacteriaceae bacterium]|nr:M48 family metalloprotease [Cyclobacteriaceae bacterium]
MEILENLIPEPYLFALGWMIIHALWQIAGIGLLLWLSLRVFNQKSAAFKYRLSLAAIAIIALISLITFGWHLDTNPTNRLSAINEAEWSYLTAQPHMIQQFQAQNEGRADWVIVSKRIEKYIPTLVNIWMVGAFLFFFKTASSLADLRSLHYKKHDSVPDKLSRLVEKISNQLALTRPIKVLSSRHVDVPLTYGILKPVILIPSALLLHMSPGQLEAIIAHEIAHIRRHDYLVNLIQSILEILFFFHPVFWWINHEIKKQREMACDELAVTLGADPKDLAHGLANVINHAQNHVSEMAMAAAKKPNPTLDRIKKIMGVKTSPTQPTTLTTITMIITLILGATLIVGAYDQQDIQENEDYLTVESSTKTLDLTLELNKPKVSQDTIPPKTVLPKTSESILEPSLSPEQMESLLKHMEPLKEMGMLFKELEFNWGDFSTMPHLELKDLPMPHFNFENMPKWEMDPEIFQGMLPDSKMLKELATIRPPMPDSLLFFKGNFAKRNDMSNEEWQQHLREQNEKLAKWKEEHADKLEAWNQERIAKTEEWKKSIEPKIQEFQAKIKGWEKENQPKMEEYQARVKAWEKENQPKIEEFQRKMEEWQKANEEKMKEFQQKMLEWQKEHQTELQELQKRIRVTDNEN